VKFGFAAAVLIFAVSGTSAAVAQDVNKRLQEIERQIKSGQQKSDALDERAKSLGQEITDVTRARIEMAKSIRDLEQRMQDLETEIAVLDTAEKQKRAALVEGRRAYGQLLTALQRMSRLPPEAVVAYPADPSDLVRAAIVLRGVVPEIEGRAASLKDDLDSLAETRAAIALRRKELTSAGASLRAERAELDKQLATVNTRQKRALAERRSEVARLEKLGREAEGLRELFEGLELEREPGDKPDAPAGPRRDARPAAPPPAQKAEPAPKTQVASAAPFATGRMGEARDQLSMPAVGRIIGQYGEPLPTGTSRKGLDIETRPGAQVVAPHEGKVVFAGPFRAYGLLLIIEHSGGYHTLLAGLSRIDATVGQRLLSGEPVGIMDPAADASPSLYVELRRNGQPINPLPWLAARKGKANG
jgi:septal ring factor EnvC (AmiA/AmiB activator)